MARKITEKASYGLFSVISFSAYSIPAVPFTTIIAEHYGWIVMKRKHYVELQEWRLALNGLNRFRNKLIAAERYTDAVDELKLTAATVSDSRRIG